MSKHSHTNVGYQFMFRSPKQRLGRLGIIEGQGQASVLVFRVVAKGDAREVGDRELELLQICQSTSLPGLSVNYFR